MTRGCFGALRLAAARPWYDLNLVGSRSSELQHHLFII